MSFIRVHDNDKSGLYAIFERILTYTEFGFMQEAYPEELTIEFMLRESPKLKAGRQILGTCYIPGVQGELKPLFDWMLEREFGYYPDFLIVLDFEYWDSVDDNLREILLFHELSHITQAMDKNGVPKFDKETGRPLWSLVGHDVEEFTSVVARYGAYNPDLELFKTELK